VADERIQAPRWQPRFIDLWPTLLVEHRLPDHEEPNRTLVALVEEMDRAHDQLTTRYQSIDIFTIDNPAVHWLRRSIDETVQTYLTKAGVNYRVGWSVRGWANINRRGDYHAPHNHAWSYLSGTYYVKMPQEKNGGREGRARPAAISFYDPRGAVNMVTLSGDPRSRYEFTVKPQSGTLLLWDSLLTHSVHPNMAEDTRITISFNLALAWADDLVAEP